MNFMKINSSLVRQCREQRAWSQEHLAEVAGLSLRTVQRVEADGGASAETRMALAAAFGMDVAALNLPVSRESDTSVTSGPEPLSTASGSLASPSAAESAVPPAVDARLTFDQYRLLRLLVVLVVLLGVDMARNGALTWSRWPVLIGAALIALRWFRSKWVQPRVRTR